MMNAESVVSIVHLRAFKPLNVAFPAPGIYKRVMLVLPALEPSVLSRLSPSGAEPLSLILDFGRDVSAKELLILFEAELELLKEIHSGAVSPLNRSIFQRLHLSTKHNHVTPMFGIENPLDSVPELKNGGQTPRSSQIRPIYRKDLSDPI